MDMDVNVNVNIWKVEHSKWSPL